MGCGLTVKRSNQNRYNFRIKTREITITPGTFVRFSPLIKLKEYQEVKKVGSGTFSDVALCEHLPTQTKRALKIIHKSGLTNHQKDNVHLLKEIQILKMLDHPNILKCFEVFEDELKYYVAMEYCPGGDLFKEILSMQVFTEAQAASIIFQVLSALSYCHDKKVIHRDLKPENILVLEHSNTLTIKVGDFGSSCILDPTNRIRGCFGSSYYLAPEVLKSSYNETCDLWSVGIIMYILLTGMPPYKGRDNKSIMIEVKEAPFQLTPDKVAGLSDGSIDLMAKLLVLDPAARIQAADAVQHPWINNHRNYKGESVKIALNNLKHFNNQSRLKEAVQIFLASQIVSHDELKEIRKNFQMLDKDGNGKITKDELMEEYMKVMNFQQASQIVDRIIAQLDQDEDGNIDYTEFLVSCGKNLQKISQDNLTIAFNLFDLDGNGVITSEELRQVLEDGQITDSVVWEELLKEADTNGDGFVDLKEFKKFMKSLSL